MHYKNGRPAQNGDKIIFQYCGKPFVGILYDAVAGNDTCNGKVALCAPSDPMPCLNECLHIDDALKVGDEVKAYVAPVAPTASS